jgi:hypothetical protein
VRLLPKQPQYLIDPSGSSQRINGMNRLVSFLFVAYVFLLAGCATTKTSQFEGKQPKLVLEEYFSGLTKATGVFEDRFGKLRRQFVVEIEGRVDGNTLILDEQFTYDDGEKQQRIWTLTRTSPTTYEGRASDVPGVAKGVLAGNAFNFKYEVDLIVGTKKDGSAKTWRVTFDDWMFLQPNEVVINRAYVSRFGFEIGSVTIAFIRK